MLPGMHRWVHQDLPLCVRQVVRQRVPQWMRYVCRTKHFPWVPEETLCAHTPGAFFKGATIS